MGDHDGGAQKSAASIAAHAIMGEGSNRLLSRMNRDMKSAGAAEAGGETHAGLPREYRTESGRVGTGAANCSSSQGNPLPATDSLMELVVARDNMIRARQRVCTHKGAPGIDGRTTDDLKTLSREHWSLIRSKLLSGTYRPDPVKRVEIPKPNGGTRLLGIPTVMDRLIQQAICQILTPVFDPSFSDHSPSTGSGP